MNEKISVIVPCYNMEKYVSRCLDSILRQSYSDLEIIIVNDGSTDATSERIVPYLPDKRVTYIEQQNKGESAARNAGMILATGDLIGFVDADDYIEADMYAKLYAAILQSDADMSVCNFNLVYESEERPLSRSYADMPSGTVDIYDDVYGYFARFCACPRPNNYVWTRLFRREILTRSGIRFESYRHSADTLFTFKLLPHLSRVSFVNEGLYNYSQRPGSGIHTIATRENIAVLYADTFQALADYYQEKGFTEFLSVLPIHAYSRLRSIFFYSRLAQQSDDEIISNIMLGFKGRDIYKYLTGAVV